MFYQMSPETVFDIALVLAVVGAVQNLRGIPWIRKAPTKASEKTRLKILAGLVSAVLAVPFTLRTTLTGLGLTLPAALIGDWFARAFLSWLFAMGAFDWLKMAMTIPNIFSDSPVADGGDIGDVDDNNRVDP